MSMLRPQVSHLLPRKHCKHTVWETGRLLISRPHSSHSRASHAIRRSDHCIAVVCRMWTTTVPADRYEWRPLSCCIRSAFRVLLHGAQIGAKCTPRSLIQTWPPCVAFRRHPSYAHALRTKPVCFSQCLIQLVPYGGLSLLLPSTFQACVRDVSFTHGAIASPRQWYSKAASTAIAYKF